MSRHRSEYGGWAACGSYLMPVLLLGMSVPSLASPEEDAQYWHDYVVKTPADVSDLHRYALASSEEEISSVLPALEGQGAPAPLRFASSQLSNVVTVVHAVELARKHAAWAGGEVLRIHVLGPEAQYELNQESALCAELKRVSGEYKCFRRALYESIRLGSYHCSAGCMCRSY